MKPIYVEDIEITPREIIFSVVIFVFMLLIGFKISSAINEAHMEQMERYNKAVKIQEQPDLFKHSLETNTPTVIAYGTITAIDPVSCYELGGQYFSVEKRTEEYTKHYRTVDDYDYRTVNGERKRVKVGSHKEEYWTWDTIERESKHVSQIDFLGVTFDYDKLYIPYENHIETVSGGYHIRYQYYGSPTTVKGTLMTDIKNHEIDNYDFYSEKSIDEVIESKDLNIGPVIFWIFWLPLTCFLIMMFYVAENKWLE